MSVPFSSRTGWNLSENALTRKVRALKATGVAVADLSESNPTRVGLEEPGCLTEVIAPRGSELYRPEPLGLRSAREAICARATHGGLAPDRTCLSASTSEAYTWLFKLLCNPGDEVLVPAPSYPLFQFLADVEAVRLVSYPLIREEGFRFDLSALEAAVTPKTRAIIVVHPNNPTGTFTHRDDARALGTIAARHDLGIISDEVFADYAWAELPPTKLPTFSVDGEALTFVLSGLSKVVCAPQLKLGWTTVHGPEPEVRRAMQRLEVIADTFLSVSTPVQLALPAILNRRASIQGELLARIATNDRELDRAIALLGPHAPVRRLAAEGGWSTILEVPRTRTEEEWIDHLLDEEKILVHPGYFFDMDRDGFLVLGLIQEEKLFRDAARRLVAVVAHS